MAFNKIDVFFCRRTSQLSLAEHYFPGDC
jgi:hypothetical protein